MRSLLAPAVRVTLFPIVSLNAARLRPAGIELAEIREGGARCESGNQCHKKMIENLFFLFQIGVRMPRRRRAGMGKWRAEECGMGSSECGIGGRAKAEIVRPLAVFPVTDLPEWSRRFRRQGIGPIAVRRGVFVGGKYHSPGFVFFSLLAFFCPRFFIFSADRFPAKRAVAQVPQVTQSPVRSTQAMDVLKSLAIQESLANQGGCDRCNRLLYKDFCLSPWLANVEISLEIQGAGLAIQRNTNVPARSLFRWSPTGPQPVPNRHPTDPQSIPNRYPTDPFSIPFRSPAEKPSGLKCNGDMGIADSWRMIEKAKTANIRRSPR
jgi:hypothetical protein